MKLNLGVIDFPYSSGDGITTGDVAEILEDKYHVMEVFYQEVGADAIANALEYSMANTIMSISQGQPPQTASMTTEAEGEIEQAFRLFLDQQEMDGMVPGVPTKAALKGINHRLKHPYAKTNLERPSFVDTGTYQGAFKAWVDPD